MADENSEQPDKAGTPGQNDLNGDGQAKIEGNAETPPPKKDDFKDAVIIRKSQELRETKRELNAVTGKLQELETVVKNLRPQDGNVTPPAPAPKVPTQKEIDALADQKAQAMLAAREFDRSCNEVWEKGTSAFPDFQQAYKEAFVVGGDPPPIEFLQNVVSGELKNPHQILYNLAQDPAEAHRIMSLPPVKQMAELVRLESKVADSKPKVSGAPPPVKPVEGKRPSGAVDLLDPNTPAEEWFRKRAEEKRAKFEARRPQRNR